jgi:hypothetical protein
MSACEVAANIGTTLVGEEFRPNAIRRVINVSWFPGDDFLAAPPVGDQAWRSAPGQYTLVTYEALPADRPEFNDPSRVSVIATGTLSVEGTEADVSMRYEDPSVSGVTVTRIVANDEFSDANQCIWFPFMRPNERYILNGSVIEPVSPAGSVIEGVTL